MSHDGNTKSCQKTLLKIKSYCSYACSHRTWVGDEFHRLQQTNVFRLTLSCTHDGNLEAGGIVVEEGGREVVRGREEEGIAGGE